MFGDPLFQIEHLLRTVLLSGFQNSPGSLKSTEMGSKFHGSDGLSKRNCLQEPIYTRSREWQIVLIFNTGKGKHGSVAQCDWGINRQLLNLSWYGRFQVFEYHTENLNIFKSYMRSLFDRFYLFKDLTHQ